MPARSSLRADRPPANLFGGEKQPFQAAVRLGRAVRCQSLAVSARRGRSRCRGLVSPVLPRPGLWLWWGIWRRPGRLPIGSLGLAGRAGSLGPLVRPEALSASRTSWVSVAQK